MLGADFANRLGALGKGIGNIDVFAKVPNATKHSQSSHVTPSNVSSS